MRTCNHPPRHDADHEWTLYRPTSCGVGANCSPMRCEAVPRRQVTLRDINASDDSAAHTHHQGRPTRLLSYFSVCSGEDKMSRVHRLPRPLFQWVRIFGAVFESRSASVEMSPQIGAMQTKW